jgi:hypothetical protein
MWVAFLTNMRVVSDQTSEVGNVKYCSELHARKVSDLSHDFKKMLKPCPQALWMGYPIPVNMGILVVVF